MPYDVDVFSCPDVEAAKAVILSPGGGLTTDQRWELETAWLKERIGFGRGLVVDYGCGIGRMSKAISNPVLGVDISYTMRQQADDYVGSSYFCAISPKMFEVLVAGGLRVNGAMALWALQHIFDVERAVEVLMCSLSPGGVFWLLDLGCRSVPNVGGGIMADDHVDTFALIERWCDLENIENLDIWPDNPGNGGELRKYRRNVHEV